MTECQILDSDNFTEFQSTDGQEPPDSRIRWVILSAGVLIFLTVVDFIMLRERQEDRREAIREDLVEIIFEEETQQFLGNIEQAALLMMPNTSRLAWQTRYRQTFSGNNGHQPGTARLRKTRLLLASPNQPNAFQIVAQAAANERFSLPVFYEDRSLLYGAEQNGRSRLQRQQPGLRAKTLLTVDHPVDILTCL